MNKVLNKALGAMVLGVLWLPLTSANSYGQEYTVETVAEGLAFPWSLAFLPNGEILVTERDGQLRVIRDGMLDPTPVANVPETFVRSQGGLLDIRLHPTFSENRLIYLSYSHGTGEANALRVARAKFTVDSLEDVDVIFEVAPLKDSPVHFGGRLAFLPDGTLLITTGDGFTYREEAQLLDNHFGKTVRINDDGSIPSDNPFYGTEGALPEIWTLGHRNPQGLLVDEASGRVYLHEHGPMGGDELNILEAGENYGWPIATYGLDYSGARVSPFTEYEGTVQPEVYWVPSIAPGGIALYEGDAFPAWQGDLFVAALAETSVRRLDMENGRVVGQDVLFQELEERIREVRVGPDGFLYLLTDSPEGRVLRVKP